MLNNLLDVKPAESHTSGDTMFAQRSTKIANIHKMFKKGNLLQHVANKEVYEVDRVGPGYALLTPQSRQHVVVNFYRSVFPFFVYRTGVLKEWTLLSEKKN